MSIKWMLDVWQNSPYEGSRLLIHLAMADSAHDNGVFFMSQALLAQRARCSVEHVRLTIRDMEKQALIVILKQGNSRKTATVYKLFSPKLPNFAGGVTGDEIDVNSPILQGEFDADSPTGKGELDPELPKSYGSHPSNTKVLLINNGSPQAAEPETAVEIATPVFQSVAKAWWEAQSVKPIGKNAWFSLLEVCKAAAKAGYSETQIRSALDYIGTVPSMRQLDLILRGRGVAQPRQTTAMRVAQQAMDVAQKLAADGQ